MYSSTFVDNAYKTGSGRYIQEVDALDLLPSEVKRLGKSRVFLITGPMSRGAAGDRCVDILKREELFVSDATVTTHPSVNSFQKLSDELKHSDCDIVVGVGGGRIMDIAKAVATISAVPVIEVPTSAATCAAFSTCIVVYKDDGAFEGAWRLTREVDCIIVDLSILARAPERLLAAGILDSVAKRLEIPHRKGEIKLADGQLDRLCSYKLSEVSYDVLTSQGIYAYLSNKNREVSEQLSNVIYANICITGVVTAFTRNLRQIALGHKFYDGLRCFFQDRLENYLHGEIVAIGLRMQAIFNNQFEIEHHLVDMMKEMNTPLTLKEIGISPSDTNFMDFKAYVRNSGFVDDVEEDKFEEAFSVTIC